MLYQMHTQSRVLLHPLMQWANNSAQQWTNQYFPLAHTPFAKQMAANCELLYRLGKHYDKPLFAIDSVLINDQAVTITEEIVLSKAFCTLLHFKKQPTAGQTTALNQAKVLLVAPLSGHHATLLRDTVRGLLPDHDVYITDWTDARMVPLAQGTFHLHDYILRAGFYPPAWTRITCNFRMPTYSTGTSCYFTIGHGKRCTFT